MDCNYKDCSRFGMSHFRIVEILICRFEMSYFRMSEKEKEGGGVWVKKKKLEESLPRMKSVPARMLSYLNKTKGTRIMLQFDL